MLQAARGIPAWRAPRIVALLLASSFAEGAALFWLAQPWHRQGTPTLALVFGALLLARISAWYAYRVRIEGHVAPRALAALDRAGRVLLTGGTVVPLALVVAALAAGGTTGTVLAALAGLAAAAAGAFVKFTLITRAGFNQGFALPRLPVRGQAPRGAR
jgi:phenylacetyl-CoA:acceptor oxidoreductase subunit 2